MASQQPTFDEATQVCAAYSAQIPYAAALTFASSSLCPSLYASLNQKELGAFLEQEQARAKMQASIHELTDRCWKT
jgi:import inner membrane translocase subunit TIM8